MLFGRQWPVYFYEDKSRFVQVEISPGNMEKTHDNINLSSAFHSRKPRTGYTSASIISNFLLFDVSMLLIA